MKRLLLLLLIGIFSFDDAYSNASLVIGAIKNQPIVKNDYPIEVCYDSKAKVYYPSRIIDLNCIQGNYIVYNLHTVVIDSCSVASIKTIQVPIPKSFEFISCHTSGRFVFSFMNKNQEIVVSFPMYYKDTLEIGGDTLYSNKNESPKFYHEVPRYKHDKVGHYEGVFRTRSYILYYFNFNRHQKEKYDIILDSYLHKYNH